MSQTVSEAAAPRGTNGINPNDPQWYQTFKRQFTAGLGPVFLLHWNTRDHIVHGAGLKEFLGDKLGGGRLFVHYNRASGFLFASPDQKRRFVELVGNTGAMMSAASLSGGFGAQQQSDPGEAMLPTAPGAALPLIEKLLRMKEAKPPSPRRPKGTPAEKPEEHAAYKAAMDAWEQAPNEPVRAVVYIDYVETITPDGEFRSMNPEDRTLLTQLQQWAIDPQINASGHPIFLVTQHVNDLHSALRGAASGVVSIEIPMPDYDHRLEYIRLLNEQGGGEKLAIPAEEFARLAAGLGLRHVEDVFLQAELSGAPVSRELILSRKGEIIAQEYDEVLEMPEPTVTFEDIGGHDVVKEFFRRNVVTPFRTGNRKRMPMGVLLIGPAGTGKTLMAEAVAKESGVNCLKLDPSKIFGSYVGESERRLRKALTCIAAMEPCVVFVDELDQQVGGRGGDGDGGTSGRVFGMMLAFMADGTRRGRVLWLGASNRPDLIDPAMKRPGRFDKKIPFLPPDETERAAILQVMARKYLPGELRDDEDFRALCAATDGWTGAEIEALAVKAFELIEDGDADYPLDGLQMALTLYRPTTAQVQHWTNLALRECNDLSLVPARFKSLLTAEREKEAAEAEAITPDTPARRGPRDL